MRDTSGPRRGVALHGLAAAVFTLLALSGVGELTGQARGLAVPSVITGAAGALGALALTWLLLRQQAGVRAQRAVRLSMAVAAVAAMGAGVVFAPDGLDRGFVISVSAVLAGALALFALLCGSPQPADRLSSKL
ncbi:hypothetical protein AB0J80_31360 [Actinoplanes sp. NPDC049548]|uniref:hypothetical protein n=1 Tax=Actinoplanes sp. NPDC049548 TaxID=3155152 RepID=UPI00343653D9